MGELPAPLVPSHVDLTDYQFMPLDVRRLRDSRLAAMVNGEEFRSAVLLWCASWHQVPSGSLPDDDIELAQLAGFGRVISAWMAVKAGAMHGWIKCSDGRFYHPVVSEKAIEGWNAKLRHDWRKQCDRIRKENKQAEASHGNIQDAPPKPQEIANLGRGIPPASETVSGGKSPPSAGRSQSSDGKPKQFDGIPAENALKGQGQGQGQGKIEDDCPKPASPLRTRSRHPADFEQFWSGYPTDKLMSKQEAGKVWGKLTEEDRASAMAAIPGFVAHCRKDPTYRPLHAVRFLAQRRFDGFAPGASFVAAVARVAEVDPLIDLKTGYKRRESQLREEIARWRENPHRWRDGELGPPPGKPGCRIPPHLLPNEEAA